MGAIEEFFQRIANETREELRGTYAVITDPPYQPHLKTTQVGGDYRLVVALHIKGLGKNSSGNGSLGKNQLTHGWRDGETLCGKRFKNVADDDFSTELTCPGCAKRAKKLLLQSPGIVRISA